MMFIVRTTADADQPREAGLRVALVRRTPAILADHPNQFDIFCVGEESVPDRLRSAGWQVVNLRDGWYQGDDEGGVVIWGQGKYWEVRDTPFTVKKAVGPPSDPP
jgi:hypothetical protein